MLKLSFLKLFTCSPVKPKTGNRRNTRVNAYRMHCTFEHLPWFILRYTWYTQIYLSLFSIEFLTSCLVENSAYPKESKQVFILLNWKEDTSIEDEGKVIATRFIISYLWLWREKEGVFKLFFSCFDYFLFILQEAILPGVTS